MERNGGPPTYLYNLKQSVVNNQFGDSIIFLADLISAQDTKENKKIQRTQYRRQFLKKIFEEFGKKSNFFNNLIILLFIMRLWVGNYTVNKFIRNSLNTYSYIHFHSVFTICLYKKMLRQFKGKIILTTHCPELPHLEYLHDLGISLKNIWGINLKYLELFEKIAFTKADYMIFPCKEALESYYNADECFKNIITENKVKYLPTCIMPASYKLPRNSIRSKYGIAESEVVLIFIGRHNAIKGYDLLLEFGKYVLSNYDNVTFIIAGKQYPLEGLHNDKWLEIGWTDDPYSLINASDLFILPNKETYFDLILLEVLSLGKSVLLSYTGGNKYFERYNLNGLMYFEKCNITDMIDVFEKNYKNVQLWDSYGSLNKKMFEDNFNINMFSDNYANIINELR